MRVLIVDDEKQLTSALSTLLKQRNFSVDCAYNGEEGVDYALSGVYDVIILDVMMPVMDGFTALKIIRQNKINTPILMLSAKSETADKINGLNYGADDYLAKPFNTEELVARIKALTRRKAEFTGDTLSFGDIVLDRNTFDLSCNGKSIKIGKKEFQILEMLILNNGKSLDKEMLIEKIWGYDTEAEYNTIEVYVSFIRKKLLAIGSKTEIRSLRNIGYILGEKND